MYDVKIEPARDGDYIVEGRNMIVITDDSGTRNHWDYGEPEDNSFNRDWDWVADELRAAYAQGKRDGQSQ